MSLTSRLKLRLMGTGSENDVQPDEPADISQINDNFRTIDTNIGWRVCTSTTRPNPPYQGMAIFETDTLRGYIYNGAVFQLVFDGNFTSGLRGSSSQRDQYWGIPGTTASDIDKAARVLLAKKGAFWFNIDKGYEQQYFAQTGDTGADINIAKTPGWYPSGRGLVPRISCSGVAGGYGIGTSVITTQANFFSLDDASVDFATPIFAGTGAGFRLIVPVEGVYRLDVSGNFNSSTINLLVKKNSVTADAAGSIAADSGNGVNALNARNASREVELLVNDFLIFAWYASTAGSTTNDADGKAVHIGLEWVRPRTT